MERRSFKTELRTEKAGGKTFLVGRAASYGVVSHNLGGWREVLAPGAFDDALADPALNCLHTVNHDPSKILGRTSSGTLELASNTRGLHYRTLMPETSYAKDLSALCARGDVCESSFAFSMTDPDDETWTEYADPDDPGETVPLRTISRIGKLFDVSTVSAPAYPGTAASVSDRQLPASMPAEIRARIAQRAENDLDDLDPDDLPDDAEPCACGCAECKAGNCDDCEDENCTDENCRCEQSMRAAHRDAGGDDSPTKTVAGEALHADSFIIVGDAKDPDTWHLPWKFAAAGETENHLRDALARFDQVKGLSEAEKDAAWDKLVHLCKAHGINVADDENDRAARELDLELATLD